MTEQIRVSYKNFTDIKIDTDQGVFMEMAEHFSFYAPGYKFMPSYKSKMWDGKIRLLNSKTKCIAAGLLHAIEKFASHPDRNYEIECQESHIFGTPGHSQSVLESEVVSYIDSLKLVGADKKPIRARDYQIAAIVETLNSGGRRLVISPTGTGKSLIMYIYMRWVLDRIEADKKFIIIVPTTTLTKQLIGDFKDYSQINGFDVDSVCYPIFAGQDKGAPQQVLVSTWQSMANFPKPFFRTVSGLIGDEAHTCTAKIVNSIIGNCHFAPWRLGTTGTLDGTSVNELVLEGLFGPKYIATTTEEQIKQGNLAKLNINIMRLIYPDSEKKQAKFKYADEVKYITKHEKRNTFVAKLAAKINGNSLVMFRYIDHGQMLYDMIKSIVPENRKVFLIHGGTDTDERNDIRGIVEKEKDAIIVASIGTFSTGINIKNLHNLIFATPHKGRIKILQSIGRTLRIATDGRDTNVYDIIDDLCWKKRSNYALKHGLERVKHYAKEKLQYKVFELKL